MSDPQRHRSLPYGRQDVDEDDIAAVVEALRSDWLTTGPRIEQFERAFATVVGARHAVAVSSGTAALHAAAFAAEIGPGDEVIVPALTFAASANCVRYLGGTVVFADVRPDTLNLDAGHVEQLITRRTKAIVAVGYAGQPPDLAELLEIAARHKLVLIEDAAHELGARYKDRAVGSIAHMTTFSFHPVKHITTGEGGMVVTNDAAFEARVRRFRNHGINMDAQQREKLGSWFYEMTDLGFNYRITDFQCALGASQLKKLSSWIARRQQIASCYDDAFAHLPEVEVLRVLPDRTSVWHLYPIRLSIADIDGGRGRIFQELRALNIGVNVHYVPVPWHPYYQRLGYQKGNWPVAEDAYERLLSLPIFPAMDDGDVAYVSAAVHTVIAASRKR